MSQPDLKFFAFMGMIVCGGAAALMTADELAKSEIPQKITKSMFDHSYTTIAVLTGISLGCGYYLSKA